MVYLWTILVSFKYTEKYNPVDSVILNNILHMQIENLRNNNYENAKNDNRKSDMNCTLF